MLDRSIAPAVTTIGDLRMPQPKIERLPNGAELLLCGPSDQEINQLTLVFPGGNVEACNPAVCKLMTMCMPEGSESMTGAQISEAVDFYGAKININCSSHHIIVTATSLNTSVDSFFPILEEVLLRPTFPTDALEVMKQKLVKTHLQNMARVMWLSTAAVDKLIMGEDNPQARRDDPSEIMAVTRQMLKDWHSRVVRANGCNAILSGNTPSWLIDRVKELLAKLPAGNVCDIAIFPFHPQPAQRTRVDKEGATQCAVRLGLPAPLRSDEDYVPLRIAVIALGGYFGSRLMRNIREDKGYTYGISASLLGMLDGSQVAISAQTDPSTVDLLIDEVKIEMAKLASEPMHAREAAVLRQYLASELMANLDGPIPINNYFQTQIVVGIPSDYYDRMVRLARDLDPAMIMAMAQKYLDPAKLRIAVAG